MAGFIRQITKNLDGKLGCTSTSGPVTMSNLVLAVEDWNGTTDRSVNSKARCV